MSEVLTTQDDLAIDEGLIVNGSINLRKTHPNLYLSVMVLGIGNIALGINFWVFTPTFRIYDFPNPLWGSIFLAIGIGKIVFLNFYRNLKLVRMTMAVAVAYLMLLCFGTMQPALEGKGSLQLPILYGTLVALQLPLLLEPFINPYTARRDLKNRQVVE